MPVMTAPGGAGQITLELLEFINDEITLDPGWRIEAETPIIEDALVDSLGVIHLVGWLEDRLGITIEKAAVTLENFASVGSMMRLVERIEPGCAEAAVRPE